MTTYVTTTPIRDPFPAFEVHQCDIPGCWRFITESGQIHHGGDERRVREQAQALKEAAEAFA